MRISDWSSDVCSSDLAVDKEHVSIVVIDSLNGYLNAMPGEQFLIIQLHELLSFLGQRGIATLMASAHHGLIGNNMSAPVDVSYLADAVILMRYFEARGEVRQAIRSEEHTSELQSLMRISYAVFCLKKKNKIVTDQA